MGRKPPRRPPSHRARDPVSPGPVPAADAGTGHAHGGLIIANHGKHVLVEDAQGTLHRCVTRRRSERPVSGDRVLWESTEARSGVVAAILPRTSVLYRPDEGGRQRALAANLDQIVIVAAPAPPFQEGLLDRYLVAAEYFRLRAVIVLNKTDTLSEPALAQASQHLAVYARLGYPVCHSSTKLADGLAQLSEQLKDRTSILVGQSGVGKSSLVKHLVPRSEVSVRAVNETTLLGRHTTVTTTLYHLPAGGDLIDSPGVRDFGLWHLPPEHIAPGFTEFRPYLGQCRFRDCRHDREPDCALRAAVEADAIDHRRFNSYHAIMQGLAQG